MWLNSQTTLQRATCGVRNEGVTTKLAEPGEQIRLSNQRLTEIDGELNVLETEQVTAEEVSRTRADFEGVAADGLGHSVRRIGR